jgi:hypothetical protein
MKGTRIWALLHHTWTLSADRRDLLCHTTPPPTHTTSELPNLHLDPYLSDKGLEGSGESDWSKRKILKPLTFQEVSRQMSYQAHLIVKLN